jgi:hypothetical protein
MRLLDGKGQKSPLRLCGFKSKFMTLPVMSPIVVTFVDYCWR